MSSALVSIIIPAHNMAPWIGETLRSVIGQTETGWECLVVDDGSSDATAEVAAAFQEPRVRVIRQQQAGVSQARNRGLKEAAGQYIAFLDADDLWHPRALQLLLQPLRADPEYVLSWADCVRFEAGSGRELPFPGTRLYHTGNAWLDLLVDNFIPFGTFCARAADAKSLTFDPSLRIGEDRDWLLRLLKRRKAVHVPAVVHYYRQRPGSAMRDTARFLEDEQAMLLPHLEAPDVPGWVRRRALSSLAFHQAVLLAKMPGKRIAALGRLLTALARDPLYAEHYLRLARKLWYTLLPAGRAALPCDGKDTQEWR